MGGGGGGGSMASSNANTPTAAATTAGGGGGGGGGGDKTFDLYGYFINCIRDRLHIVLCFSPLGDRFRRRAQRFPGLVSGCVIQSYSAWDADALEAVSRKFMRDCWDEIDAPTEVKDSLAMQMARTHGSAVAAAEAYFQQHRRPVHFTPKSFLSYLAYFRTLYASKHAHVMGLADTLRGGLGKLEAAAEDVARMRIELVEKDAQLAEAQAVADTMLTEITEKRGVAEREKAKVEATKVELEALVAVISRDRAACAKELEAARPALEAAEAALDQIKPSDIAVTKKLANPPNLVKRIMDGVLILRRLPLRPAMVDSGASAALGFTVPVSSFENAVRAMADTRFLDHLLNFPADRITPEDCELLDPYLAMPDFTHEAARKSCGNLAGLASWLKAMHA
jgi:dynein heavy chain